MTSPLLGRVIGAGPAGLVAATTLARAGQRVEVWERAATVGGRFAGDFQGQEAGAVVRWRTRAEHTRAGDIVATGPRFADGLVVGYLFDTDLPDQAHCILSKRLAPAGYAYLLVQGGRATLASCLFTRQQHWREAREDTADTFRRLLPEVSSSLAEARPFAGYGTVFGTARLGDEAGRLYVGEAAGLQDPEWGFGLWYAMASGQLAATCLLDGRDYPRPRVARSTRHVMPPSPTGWRSSRCQRWPTDRCCAGGRDPGTCSRGCVGGPRRTRSRPPWGGSARAGSAAGCTTATGPVTRPPATVCPHAGAGTGP